MKIRALAATAIALPLVSGGIVFAATPAFAGVNCTGHSNDGLCLFENASYVPPDNWWATNFDDATFTDDKFAGTNTVVDNQASSAQNNAYCNAFIYKNVNYGVPAYQMVPKSRTNFAGTNIGNDSASSVYWTGC